MQAYYVWKNFQGSLTFLLLPSKKNKGGIFISMKVVLLPKKGQKTYNEKIIERERERERERE